MLLAAAVAWMVDMCLKQSMNITSKQRFGGQTLAHNTRNRPAHKQDLDSIICVQVTYTGPAIGKENQDPHHVLCSVV